MKHSIVCGVRFSMNSVPSPLTVRCFPSPTQLIVVAVLEGPSIEIPTEVRGAGDWADAVAA